jgi:hypothetical protein
MHSRPFRPALFAAVMTIFGVLAMLGFPDPGQAPAGGEGEDTGKGKLVVLVVFDQMRADYLTRWQELFDKDGFGCLQKQGAWFQNCHYPYAFTLTAPGHASIVTGCSPCKHGVIANDWYDPITRQEVGAVKADRYPTVPHLAGKTEGAAPIYRLQDSVGDGLQKMTRGKAKVVSLSIKDRSAILMAALRAAVCYWFDTLRGLFVTSTYYRDAPHRWVAELNRERPADRYFGKDWTRLRPDLDYVRWSGPDDVDGEGIGYKQGRTFPHPMTGGLEQPGKNYYEAFTFSPFANEVLLELAKRAIHEEKLGQRDVADLLCLSFSSNDLIGHCWGPDSQEVLDVTLRSDLLIKDLLKYLDEKVGRDRYVLVLTADHGVAPLAEVALAQGKDAGRVPPALFTTQAAEFLQATFAPGAKPLPWVEKAVGGWVYLNHGTLKELGLPAAKVQDALAQWLEQQRGVAKAYTHERLLRGEYADGPIGRAMQLSFYAPRCGDVGVMLKPYYMVLGPVTDSKNNAYRATHGLSYPFDTHVPLVVYGAGVRSGIHGERVTPLAAAAMMARALSIPPPPAAEEPLPQGVFR